LDTGRAGPGPEPAAAARGGRNMWYVIFFMVGVLVGSLVTFLRGETRCRDCGARENCEQFP
jgi:hypothetical protein